MLRRRVLPVAMAAFVVAALGSFTAGAATLINVQANEPQIAGDATSDSTAVFPANKQNEPTIAVNPVNANRLIAGTNDEQQQPPCGPGPVRGPDALPSDCSFFPEVGTSGVYTSSDGGDTWINRGLLPGFTDYGDDGTLISDGDPVIVYGPKPTATGFSYANGARAYYATLASYASGAAKGRQAPELLAVSISDDNGLHWSDPVVAASAHGYVFNDKEAIWVDDNPASAYFGRAYVSWTQFRDILGCAEPIMVARSADGGTTWSRPQQLSAAQNCGLGGRQGSTLRTSSSGTVYAVWEDSDVNGYKQVVSRSQNGGVTWTLPSTIAYIHDISANGDFIPGANFRVDSFASLAIDQSSGTLYVAWADLRAGGSRMVVSTSTNGGRAWSTPRVVSASAQGSVFFQGLDVAPNGRVDLAFQGLKAVDPSTFGAGNAKINAYYVKSTDGTTWSSPRKVSTASSDPAASSQNNLALQFWGDYSTLVSTNSEVWFIATDSRNGVPCVAVDAYQHGLDGSGPVVAKPAPGIVCPGQFGNTDAYVSVFTP
ncbi:MAG: sialidase family protein [Actinomycetota bacterium]